MYFLNENKFNYGTYKFNERELSDIKKLYSKSINQVKGKLSTKIKHVSFPIVKGTVKINIDSEKPLTLKDKKIISKQILKNSASFPHILNYMNMVSHYSIQSQILQNQQLQSALISHQMNQQLADTAHQMAIQQHQMADQAASQMHQMAMHQHNMGMGMF